MLLSRAQICAARLPHRDIEVPEWGGAVRVQQMSAQVRIDYLAAIRENSEQQVDWDLDQAKPAEERKNLPRPADVDPAHLAIVKCLIDENGVRLFGDADSAALLALGYPIIRKLWEAVVEVNELNGSTAAAVESEKKD